jgi:hypothetical protein
VLGKLLNNSQVPPCGTALFREDVSPSVFETAIRAVYTSILTVADITTKP